MDEPRQVYVVGGGPAGLAAAAELRRRGMHPVVLERGEQVGTSWRAGYDRLHLHTVRGLSGLPGFGFPRAAGRWPSRDAVIDYLERYRARHGLEVRGGTEVARIAAAQDGDGIRWVIHTTAGERLPARSVVVATGHAHTPYVPDWPGLETYTGQLRHAREYRNPVPFAGLDVLVVGVGNSGSEIAVDLAEGGARRVWIAVRTPPQIVRRDVAGWPAHATGILVSRLPHFRTWVSSGLCAAAR
jgi:putative flavoprotein involved in K+ transport